MEPEINFKCVLCNQDGRLVQSLECTICKHRCHYACLGIATEDDANLRASTFVCPNCHRRSAQHDLNMTANDAHVEDGSGSSGSHVSHDDNEQSRNESLIDFTENTIQGAAATNVPESNEMIIEGLQRQIDQLMTALHEANQENRRLRSNTNSDHTATTEHQSSMPNPTTPASRTIPSVTYTISTDAPPSSSSSTPYAFGSASTTATSAGVRPSVAPSSPNVFNYPTMTTAASTWQPRGCPTTQIHQTGQFAYESYGPTSFQRPIASTSVAPTMPGPHTLPYSIASSYASQGAGFNYTFPVPAYDNRGPFSCFRQTKTEPLPAFDGRKPEVWVSFEAVYKHLKNSGFQRDELISEISTAVTGNARRFIEDILIIRGEPDDMVATLKKRYGDPNKVLGDIAKAIERSKPPRDLPKEQLLDFALLVKSLVTTAKAFGNETYLSHPFLCDKIVEMLRDKHRDWWQMHRQSNPGANVATLAEYLLDRATDPSATRPAQSKGTRSKVKEANMLVHEERADNNNNARLQCFRCDEKHRLRTCPEFKGMSPDERMNWIKTTSVCSCCLSSTSHFWKFCNYKRECGVDGCKYNHNPMLHVKFSSKADASKTIVTNSSTPNPNNKTKIDAADDIASVMTHTDQNGTLYKILPLLFQGANGEILEEFALIDMGSNRTLMEESLFKRLGLSGTLSPIKLKWTQNVETIQQRSYSTTLRIKGMTGTKWRKLENVNTISNLNLPCQSLNLESLRSKYRHLTKVPVIGYNHAKPSMIIGLQHAKLCSAKRTIGRNEDEPLADKTSLGWVVYGQVHKAVTEPNDDTIANCNVHHSSSDEPSLNDQLRSYFTVDGLGIDPDAVRMSPDDMEALKMAEATCRKVGERYQIGLLWKASDVELPNNYKMALNRLQSFEKSLRRQPKLLEWTNKRINEMLSRGYLRPATPEEIADGGSHVWYLPTFLVINRNKDPPKPRLVFDAAATFKGVSLNSQLLTGPDLVTPLISGTCRFRESQYVVTGDVREMYHQVLIAPEDQQSQRILWRNCDPTKPPTVYILQVMAFGTAPSSFSAQYVKNAHAEKYRQSHPVAAKAIIEYMYVDDYLNGHSTVDEAVETTLDVIHILDEAGFELRSIQSNSVEIMRRCPQDRINTQLVDLQFNFEPEALSKILGLSWNPKDDTLTYKLNPSAFPTSFEDPTKTPTKREVLSTVMKVFDPMGHLAHIIIRGKVILQRIWASGTTWDQLIVENLDCQWTTWVELIKQLHEVTIPRRYAPVDLNLAAPELHVFCDASELAFAAIAFLRVVWLGVVYISQVMAKARVMPVKPITIPRAELTAAVMAVRLANTIKTSHTCKFENVTYWTDSKCVLDWINAQGVKFKPFIRFRIGEILDSSHASQWRHVPGVENVADDATKPNPNPLDTNSRWFRGPDFLHEPPTCWPNQYVATDLAKENFIGVVEEVPEASDAPFFPLLENISDRYSKDWPSLVRVVAYRIRFLNWKICKQKPKEGFLTPGEMQTAENYIFRSIQAKHFASELETLRTNGTVKKTSRLYQLTPTLDDNGLIRLDTRFQNSRRMSYASRNPIILPPDDPIVDVMVYRYHRMSLHQGDGTTIGLLRERVWIIRVAAVLKRVKKNCMLCKLIYAKTVSPRMGNLPTIRIEPNERPWTHVGVDVCGPFDTVDGRKHKKMWVMMFTCLTTRAVHTEIINEMSAQRCLTAIQDFKNQRGPCQHFYSDCGTNFEGAKNQYDKDLREMLPYLAKEIARRYEIHWHFNPARTPHWGGVWERLIRSLKTCLKAEMAMQPRLYTYDSFRSALLEVCNRINSRPLTHIPINSYDERPLTPNDFILAAPNDHQVAGIFTEKDICSRSSYRRARHLANVLWARWVKEYVPTMALRPKWREDVNEPIVQVGDVVLMAYPGDARETWRKGLVVKVHPGKDGRVRVASVREASGKIKIRSAHTLVPLQVKSRCGTACDGGECVSA